MKQNGTKGEKGQEKDKFRKEITLLKNRQTEGEKEGGGKKARKQH